jgi:hypothetical protein
MVFECLDDGVTHGFVQRSRPLRWDWRRGKAVRGKDLANAALEHGVVDERAGLGPASHHGGR